MFKLPPLSEYSAPSVDVLEIVSEQDVFTLSYGGDNEAGKSLGDDLVYDYDF